MVMPRDLAVSNGRLLVMFDRQYRIRDVYFPHVGKENHGTGHAFRFGVWVGGLHVTARRSDPQVALAAT
jgi:GH15 family glucan-1,4-alpha-glucosidase